MWDDRTANRNSALELRWILGITVLLAALPLLPRPAIWLGTAALGGCSLAAAARRMRFAAPLAGFFGLFFLLMLIGLPLSQLSYALALVGYALAVRFVPWLRGSAKWLRRGRVARTDLVLALGFTLLSGVSLLLWVLLLRPNLDDLLAAFVPDASLPVLLLGGLALACVNAAVEEGCYRGVLHETLERTLPGRIRPLVLQAIVFGTMHINGFPRGAVGVVLATVYGLMMGWLRVRTGGLLLPWAAHVATDFVIALILILLVRAP